MEDFAKRKESVKNQSKTHPFSKDQIEEMLRRQNVDAMVEIYGVDILKKIRKSAPSKSKLA